jgi:hypothetical protein
MRNTPGGARRGHRLSLDQPDEPRRQIGIKLAARAAPDLLQRVVAGHGPAVHPVLGHRVIGVHDGQQPGQQRNLVPGEAPRIAEAVPLLVVGQDVVRHVGQLRRRGGDAVADFGVLFHLFPFLVIEPAGLVEDAVVHAHLADVVQHGVQRQLVHLLLLQPQRLAHPAGEAHQPLAVGLGFAASGQHGGHHRRQDGVVRAAALQQLVVVHVLLGGLD